MAADGITNSKKMPAPLFLRRHESGGKAGLQTRHFIRQPIPPLRLPESAASTKLKPRAGINACPAAVLPTLRLPPENEGLGADILMEVIDMDWMGKLSIFPLYIVFSLFFKWIISWDVAEKSKSGRQAGSSAGRRGIGIRSKSVYGRCWCGRPGQCFACWPWWYKFAGQF